MKSNSKQPKITIIYFVELFLAIMKSNFKDIVFTLSFLVFTALSYAQQKTPSYETCLLHHCKGGQMESNELIGVKKLEVRTLEGEILQIISFKLEIIFHDDVINYNVKGDSISDDIYKVISNLDAGSVIKIWQVKAKEKSGNTINAPDLILKTF